MTSVNCEVKKRKLQNANIANKKLQLRIASY
jgi:hypothetical protein